MIVLNNQQCFSQISVGVSLDIPLWVLVDCDSHVSRRVLHGRLRSEPSVRVIPQAPVSDLNNARRRMIKLVFDCHRQSAAVGVMPQC